MLVFWGFLFLHNWALFGGVLSCFQRCLCNSFLQGFFQKCKKLCSENTRLCFFEEAQKSWWLIGNVHVTKNCILLTISDLIFWNPYFSAGSWDLGVAPFCCSWFRCCCCCCCCGCGCCCCGCCCCCFWFVVVIFCCCYCSLLLFIVVVVRCCCCCCCSLLLFLSCLFFAVAVAHLTLDLCFFSVLYFVVLLCFTVFSLKTLVVKS